MTEISSHTLKTEKISYSFQDIPYLICNYSSSKTFEVHKHECMDKQLKIKVFRKSILFCNESWDLHEILCGGQLLSIQISLATLKIKKKPSTFSKPTPEQSPNSTNVY